MAKQKSYPNMQRRIKPTRQPLAVIDDDPARKINRYSCRDCGEAIITLQTGEALNGTTPMMMACKVTKGCNGTMMSSMYQVSQDPTPTFEWYKPSRLPKNQYEREHVKRGGLLLRKLEGKPK